MTPTVTTLQLDDRHVVQIVANLSTPQPVEQAPASCSQSLPPWFNAQSPVSLPNYISQDEDNNSSSARRTSRSAPRCIMQEAMLSCVDIYKPQYVVSVDLGILNYIETPKLTGTTYTVTPKQMVQRKLPMMVMQNGKSSAGSKQRTLGVLPPHCKPNHKGHLAALVWKWDRTTCPGNVRLQHWHQHHRLHQEKPGPTKPSKERDLPPHHLPHKTWKNEEPNWTKIAAGGNRVHYPGNAGTPTANLLTVKLLINSTISTPNIEYMTTDIKDFYLNTPMAHYEYIWLQVANMLDNVIKHYKLTNLATPDGYVFCEIQKGMCGLPQARIIAQ